jgi:ribosomal protein S18 acetylase RimI-like enzyme
MSNQSSLEDYPVRLATRSELPILAALAHRIWQAHYPGIISQGQIEYMLESGYAIPTLEAELESGVLFPLIFDQQNAIGFAAYGPTETPFQAKLHKLYLDIAYHGLGLGQRLLNWIESSARSDRFTHLVLQVNKNNAKAIAAYRRRGYAIQREVVVEIGQGYLMDDFVMEKSIT